MAQTNVASGPMYKTNFAFAVMLIGMVGYFIYWGLGYTNHNHTTMFLLATFSVCSWHSISAETMWPIRLVRRLAQVL